jgi:hypothetical protein
MELNNLQTKAGEKFDKILTDEQREQLREMSRPGSGGLGGFAAPGQVISLSREVMLKPTDEQKQKLADLQRGVDDELGRILTSDQKAQFERIKHDFGRGGSVASGHHGAPGAALGRSGANGSGAGRLPPGVNPIFRALRYGPQYEGLAGKDLRPAE